jgi:hypothetical protein
MPSSLITVQPMNDGVCFMEWVHVLTRGRTNVRTVSCLQEVVRSDEHVSLESAIVPSVGRVLFKGLLYMYCTGFASDKA